MNIEDSIINAVKNEDVQLLTVLVNSYDYDVCSEEDDCSEIYDILEKAAILTINTNSNNSIKILKIIWHPLSYVTPHYEAWDPANDLMRIAVANNNLNMIEFILDIGFEDMTERDMIDYKEHLFKVILSEASKLDNYELVMYVLNSSNITFGYNTMNDALEGKNLSIINEILNSDRLIILYFWYDSQYNISYTINLALDVSVEVTFLILNILKRENSDYYDYFNDYVMGKIKEDV